MNDFDTETAPGGQFPKNSIVVDALGRPSVMVYVPAFRLSDVIDGAGDGLHPAFVSEGRALPGIYISKFQNVVREGIADSLYGEDPATGIDFDGAARACAAKGRGWHLMTAMEWGAIALWCQKNGFLPFGNNDLGKDVREDRVSARIAYSDAEKGICRTATGTGPAEWSHNGREDGICDLNGNVWEWVGGLRLVHGEVQVIPDNDGAAGVSQGADSVAWRAIDGRTGEYIRPGGGGTTENSVKLDFIDGVWTYTSGQISDSYAHARFCDFNAVHASETLCERARMLLAALGLLPVGDGALREGVSLYANNGASERMAFRGGRWGQGLNTGVFKTCLDDPRTYAGAAVGFRAAYCPPPSSRKEPS